MRHLDSVVPVRSEADFALVERRLSSLVYGIKGRANILNTVAFARLRLAAMYPVGKRTISASHGHIQVVLQDGVVSIYCGQAEPESAQGEEKGHDPAKSAEAFERLVRPRQV